MALYPEKDCEMWKRGARAEAIELIALSRQTDTLWRLRLDQTWNSRTGLELGRNSDVRQKDKGWVCNWSCSWIVVCYKNGPEKGVVESNVNDG